jgi:hypothetical protein
MMRHLLDALGRDPAAAQDVRQERPDVVHPLRATERNQEDRIKRHW